MSLLILNEPILIKEVSLAIKSASLNMVSEV